MVAVAPAGTDGVGVGCDGAQFLPQGFDVAVHGTVVDVVGVIPQGVQQLVAVKGLAGVGEQVAQQAVFVTGEVKDDAVVADGLRAVVVLPDADCLRLAAAAADRLDARDEFAVAEGFAAVVVRAEFEANDAVDFFVARAEEDERRLPLLADAAAEFKAVGVGQADVEHDAVKALHLQGGKRGDAGVVPHHLPLFTRERVAERVGNGGVVFDEEDVFHAVIISNVALSWRSPARAMVARV